MYVDNFTPSSQNILKKTYIYKKIIYNSYFNNWKIMLINGKLIIILKHAEI